MSNLETGNAPVELTKKVGSTILPAPVGERSDAARAEQQTDLEPLLKVGTGTTFQEDNDLAESKYYKSVIRGWYKNRYLILDRPLGVGVIKTNAVYIVRFVLDGTVCGFTARFLDEFVRNSSPVFRLEWPTEFITANIRSHERVDVRWPCSIRFGSEEAKPAEIRNLSKGGCSLHCEQEFTVNDKIHISFKTPRGLEIVEHAMIVRNRIKAGAGCMTGCSFENPHEELDTVIEFLVATQSSDKRFGTSDKRPILILEARASDVRPLREELQQLGHKSIVATDAMDGLSCIPELRPEIILFGHGEGESSVSDVCSVLKRTPGLEATPVFVYNMSEQDQTKIGKHDGVTAYFSPDTPTAEICALVGSKVEGENRQSQE